MAGSCSSTAMLNAQDSDGLLHKPPLYVQIHTALQKAIWAKSLPPGTVLLEGRIAELFGSTRTPVRHALRVLETDGLVSRFAGRGYLVGSSDTLTPLRVTLEPYMLSMDGSVHMARKALGWELIYDDVERDLVHLSIFGSYRINEVEMARHFHVGRTAVRDVLQRLESLGILSKDERMRWVTRPLDAGRISDLYELRCLLEPVALRQAIGQMNKEELRVMITALDEAQESYPIISRAAMDELEQDLHVKLLSKCSNQELMSSLERTRCILTLSKHVLGQSTPMPVADPFMSEHVAILRAAYAGAPKRAAELLRDHLTKSCDKVVARAEDVREHFALPSLPFIA